MLFLDWWLKFVHWYHGYDLIRTLLAGVVLVQWSVDLLFCQLLALRMKIYKSHTHDTEFLELYFGGVFEISTWIYLFILFLFYYLFFFIWYCIPPGGTPLMLFTGRLRAELQPLPFYVQKRYHFRVRSIDKWYPFHIPSHTPRCISFNCKCAVV